MNKKKAIRILIALLVAAVGFYVAIRNDSKSPAANMHKARAALERQDYAAAERIVRPLAEAGDRQARFALGLMYQYGRGVPHNDVLAHAWISLAAEQGEPEAAEQRDIVAKRMTREQIAKAERLAAKWEEK